MLDSVGRTGHQRARWHGQLSWGRKSTFCLTWCMCRPPASWFSRKGYLGEGVGLAPWQPFERAAEPLPLPQPAIVRFLHGFGVMGTWAQTFWEMGSGCIQMATRLVGTVSKLAWGHLLTTEGKNQSLTSTGLIISHVMKCYFLCRTLTILEKLFPNQNEWQF